MGISSGDSFGSGGGSSFGSSSSGGRFDFDSSTHHHHHHRDPFYSNSFVGSFRGNNQRESSGGSGCEGGCGKPCSIFVPFFTCIGSLIVIFGFFQSEQAPMSLNYSRLISTYSVFVKEIQIQNLRDPGPVIYSFSERPALRESVDYIENHVDLVETFSHREWRYWLNKGSTIRVSYDVKGLAGDSLVLAFIKGTQGLEDWKKAPNSPTKALKWYRIHGNGIKEFVVDHDDEHFIAFGNLNIQDMEVTTEMKIHSTLYDVKGAKNSTAFTPDFDAVTFHVSLFQSDCLVLATPSEPQGGVDVWEVHIVYTARWATFFLIWGTIALGLFILCGAEARGVRLWRNNQEELPLLAPQNDQAVPSAVTSYSPSGTAHPPLGSLDELGESPSSDHHLCNICLDAPKDCFFDPCGHRCTCFTCGQRIQGNSSTCPICRQPIRAVRKIFDT
ncbi:E3 ubiquitin-protein ligase APD2 [Physcomitrium patens]|uniref:RING-type domain-containing protein n=2 Tax=Physcomitrium patens TaxID=3218 RepID=A0A2K1INW4_PHYPA|nr:uncharacterized protein LOC112275297 [Physcomitrium patens]XP_024361310.1 uncharacterized protein LOC112275297 [Physcomitrium patens]PNR30948.1 hypothetical protein PHYPA_027264 [Physcomitrium patens]|eukprot:XP_024361309.1 uncharacterized protein LOC112275297 [Physcomitrella patens]